MVTIPRADKSGRHARSHARTYYAPIVVTASRSIRRCDACGSREISWLTVAFLASSAHRAPFTNSNASTIRPRTGVTTPRHGKPGGQGKSDSTALHNNDEADHVREENERTLTSKMNKSHRPLWPPATPGANGGPGGLARRALSIKEASRALQPSNQASASVERPRATSTCRWSSTFLSRPSHRVARRSSVMPRFWSSTSPFAPSNS